MLDRSSRAIDSSGWSGSGTTDPVAVDEALQGASKNVEAAMLTGQVLVFGTVNGTELSGDSGTDGAENDWVNEG